MLFDNGLAKQRARTPEAAQPRAVNPPPVDVYENDQEFLVVAEVPGARADAVTVKLDKDQLFISARREAKAEGALVAGGRPDFDYQRTFVVPRGIDASAISAELDQGVLRLHLPKGSELKPRTIPVQTA